MDYLHGHSLIFKNFANIVKKSNTMICKHCKGENDSSSHQLFECSKFVCQERIELLGYLNNNIDQYQFKIILCREQEIAKVFANLVNYICSHNPEDWQHTTSDL